MTVEEQAKRILATHGSGKLRVRYLDGTVKDVRVFLSPSNGICQYRRRSRRYGWSMSFHDVASVAPVSSRKTKAQKWEDGWRKVKARLEKSGLWEDIAKNIDLALEIGYDTLQQAYQDYWEMDAGNRLNNSHKEFAKKYPRLIYKNDEGKDCVNVTILWYISKMPRVKKMRFERGSYNNEKLALIRQQMDAGNDCHASGRYKYDVSFSYIAEKKKAWYSEEFRGCGNGHYYLALDATHVIFWEDD